MQFFNGRLTEESSFSIGSIFEKENNCTSYGWNVKLGVSYSELSGLSWFYFPLMFIETETL